jgi:hypoxanthine phosphoribosyltransferase
VADVRLLFDERRIAGQVEALADAVVEAMGREFTIVALLTGAFVFTADLARALGRRGARPRIEFVGIKSYGDATVSSGRPALVGNLPDDLGGRRVLIVDDILDTGHALAFARDAVRAQGAGETRTCVLLDKRARRAVPIDADFAGFTIEDGFVVGYGVDHAQDYRYLPYLGLLAEA